MKYCISVLFWIGSQCYCTEQMTYLHIWRRTISRQIIERPLDTSNRVLTHFAFHFLPISVWPIQYLWKHSVKALELFHDLHSLIYLSMFFSNLYHLIKSYGFVLQEKSQLWGHGNGLSSKHVCRLYETSAVIPEWALGYEMGAGNREVFFPPPQSYFIDKNCCWNEQLSQ